MTLAELQRIKQWHVAHRAEHPLEYHLWDGVLTLWLLGWVGMLPVAIFGVVGIAAPDLYIAWRTRAHRASRLRCDWIVA